MQCLLVSSEWAGNDAYWWGVMKESIVFFLQLSIYYSKRQARTSMALSTSMQLLITVHPRVISMPQVTRLCGLI